jgi:MFS family permease
MAMDQNPDAGQQHERWNLAVLMLDVTFFALGMAFIDSSAVLPLLLERLGATGVIIGAAAALRSIGLSGFQIFVAYRMHGKVRQKPWLAIVATVSRLPLLAMPLFMLNADRSPALRVTALWAIIIILAFWALGDGLGYVPWMEIVARAFTPRLRGRFFASTQVASGLGSIIIGLIVVRTILHSKHLPYPTNYALLTGAAALMFMVSLAGVLLIKEPTASKSEHDQIGDYNHRSHFPTLGAYFRRVPGLLRDNPIFVKLSLIQLLLGFGAAAAPFYVLYATDRFRIGDEWGGIYQAIQALGVVTLTPLWTFLSERRSPAAAVRALATAVLLTPLVAITVGTLSPWMFGMVFFLMGGSLGWGLWIVMNHYLLSHVGEQERPVYVALINLLFAPSALFPWFGGVFVHHASMVAIHGVPILFVITAAVVCVGFVLSLKLAHIE